jgi:hypothetical protein
MWPLSDVRITPKQLRRPPHFPVQNVPAIPAYTKAQGHAIRLRSRTKNTLPENRQPIIIHGDDQAAFIRLALPRADDFPLRAGDDFPTAKNRAAPRSHRRAPGSKGPARFIKNPAPASPPRTPASGQRAPGSHHRLCPAAVASHPPDVTMIRAPHWMLMRIPRWMLWFVPLLCVTGVFFWVACYRRPSEAEFIQRFQITPITSLTIDRKQGDVGMFGITAHSPSGDEQFWIEVGPQWIWPWQSYDWER